MEMQGFIILTTVCSCSTFNVNYVDIYIIGFHDENVVIDVQEGVF